MQPLTTPSPPPPIHVEWDIERERAEVRLQQALLDKKYQQLERDRAELRAEQKQLRDELRE